MTDTRTDTPAPGPGAPTRRVWWIVGGTFTALVLVAVLAATGVWVWASATPAESDDYDKTYTRAVANVAVDLEVGAVNLAASADDAFEVRRESTWRGKEPSVSEEWTDADSWEAESDCGERWLHIRGGRCEVEYWLNVPAGTGADITTSVADVTVDGLDGDLRLESSVGRIDAERLRTTSTVVTSSTGDVHLAFDRVLGDITVDANVGDVVIVVPDDGTTYDVRFDSGVGESDITIATDFGGADYLIDVSSGVGDLEVRYG
ncbi:DUF4097 family beta strand repeat-containing protein [Glycomyces halotolerans]